MKYLLIGDLHFGIRGNSITWLENQKDYFYKVIIPLIKKEPFRIIQLGDIFDSRSTIDIKVMNSVIELFQNILDSMHSESEMYILAGNHDFYTQQDSENHDNINSIDTILRAKLKGRVQYATNNILYIQDSMFVSYNSWEHESYFKGEYDKYKPKYIFTHTDLENTYPWIEADTKIFSGHIHTPCLATNRYTLGASYALTFADHDSQRGAWIYNTDDDSLIQVTYNNSIKFYRVNIHNLDDIQYNIKPNYNDYIELYINEELLSHVDVIEYISSLSKNISSSHLYVLPIPFKTQSFEIESTNLNINNIIDNYIPAELQDKFNIIKQEYDNR